MAQRTVSDLIVERLQAWGVDRVFGYSGDGINGFMGALHRAQDAVEFVQARHDEAAAFRHPNSNMSTESLSPPLYGTPHG